MGRHSEKPYIERLPHRHRHSKHSSQDVVHYREDHHYAEQSSPEYLVNNDYGQLVEVYDRNEQALAPYDAIVTQGKSDECWKDQKHRLENRFELSHKKHRLEHRVELSHRNQRVAPPHHSPSISRFARWIKDNKEDYPTPGKIKDLADRLSHNISDFIPYFESCAQYGARNSNMGSLYHAGMEIISEYNTIVAGYDSSSFKSRHTYSSTKRAEAQQLLEDIVDRHYNQ
ncbi:hypothetical protein F5Y12DRAFT_794059 [Xylaria sp. FL1777]|nr:hypothetical protein F5Y12DRAFT_794059 [Xylaria sp. FL1777]